MWGYGVDPPADMNPHTFHGPALLDLSAERRRPGKSADGTGVRRAWPTASNSAYPAGLRSTASYGT